MGLNILLIILFILLVYYGYRVGAFEATVTFFCVVAASGLTFMFADYLSEMVMLRFFTKNTQAAFAASYWILLIVLFIAFRQTATHFFNDEKMRFQSTFYKLGGLVVGFLLAHTACGALVLGWFAFPFAYAVPPPDMKEKKVVFQLDEAYLHHVTRLSRLVGPKDEARRFNAARYIDYRNKAREIYEKRKAGQPHVDEQPPSGEKLSPGEAVKEQREEIKSAGE